MIDFYILKYFFIFIFLESSTICQILVWRSNVVLLVLLGRQSLSHLILAGK